MVHTLLLWHMSRVESYIVTEEYATASASPRVKDQSLSIFVVLFESKTIRNTSDVFRLADEGFDSS